MAQTCRIRCACRRRRARNHHLHATQPIAIDDERSTKRTSGIHTSVGALRTIGARHAETVDINPAKSVARLIPSTTGLSPRRSVSTARTICTCSPRGVTVCGTQSTPLPCTSYVLHRYDFACAARSPQFALSMRSAHFVFPSTCVATRYAARRFSSARQKHTVNDRRPQHFLYPRATYPRLPTARKSRIVRPHPLADTR